MFIMYQALSMFQTLSHFIIILKTLSSHLEDKENEPHGGQITC